MFAKAYIGAAILLASALISGCQTSGSSSAISKEEALKIAVEFQAASPVVAARSIDGFLGKFEILAKWPCGNSVQDTPSSRREMFKKIIAGLPEYNNQRGITKQTEAQDGATNAFLRGNVSNAVEYTDWAITTVRRYNFGSNPWTGYHAIHSYQQAFYLAYAGDLERAESLYFDGTAYSTERWQDPRNVYWLYAHQYMADGAIKRQNGRLDAAELSFNTALGFLARAMQVFEGDNSRFAGWWTRRYRGKILLVKSELGLTLLAQGREAEAEALLRDTVNFSGLVEMDSKLYIAFLIGRVSEVLSAQNRHLDAFKTASLAKRIYSSVCADGGLSSAEVRERLARAQLALGNFDDAKNTYAEMDKYFEADKRLLNLKFGDSLARAFNEILSGDYSEASKRLDLALNRTIERFGKGTSRQALIIGLRGLMQATKGETEAARPLFEQAMVEFYQTQGQADSRDDWLKKYITDGYLDLLQKGGSPDDLSKAFEIAQTLENGKVQQALRQNAARAGANNPELADLIRQEQDLGQQIDALRRTLNSALSSADSKAQASAEKVKASLPALFQARQELAADIANKFPEFDELINPRPLTVAKLQSHLPSNGAVVVVRTTDSATQVWAVPKQGDLIFKTIPIGRIELNETVKEIRRAVDPGAIASLGDIPAFDTATAYELYNALLAPVSKAWKQSRSLYVVTQGPLGQLPLSLLPTTPNSKGDDGNVLFAGYRNVNWLANSHAVTVLPSVGAVATFSGQTSTAKRRPFVGFGDPFFSGGQALAATKPVEVAQNTQTRSVTLRSKPQTRSVNSADLAMLPRLPDTRPELQGIARSLGANQATDLYLGLRANEQQVKTMDLRPYKVIAFATHGLVPGDLNGLHQPALALSAPGPSKSEGDGLLTMAEILGLRLNADWAVLSACNTAAADGEGAEAISGLGRAFFYAGARALLVSSWPVHSGATTELTTTLFGLQAKDRTLARAEALRQARQHLIRNAGYQADGKMLFAYAHPIFWAPFTIVGDGR